jgi:aspartyl-tRNA(Asn)/glutamyl-tRNA(Gln) amidotransferase subunit B
LDVVMPDGEARRVMIQKLHLEEDAGKTVYQGGKRLIDFNRCGVPLLEMVTGPDLRSADEAAQYLIRLRQLLRWLGISEADMERGHLRCDANVSIRPAGADYLNPKTEIKNVNSIENLRAAIKAEIERQVREFEAGHTIEAWTLNWDEDSGTLRKMRSKETEADYRYFREPDLLPIRVDGNWLTQIQYGMPELPLDRRDRFMQQYGLPAYDAEILTEERSLSDYFEAAVAAFGGEPKVVSNWMINDLMRMIREQGVSAADLRIKPHQLAEIIRMVESRTITGNTGKDLLDKVLATDRDPTEIVEKEGLALVSDEDALRSLASEILAQNAEQVRVYKAGKTALMGWFVGQMMRATRGKADAQLARRILEDLLSK